MAFNLHDYFNQFNTIHLKTLISFPPKTLLKHSGEWKVIPNMLKKGEEMEPGEWFARQRTLKPRHGKNISGEGEIIFQKATKA